jgi:iron(III) transport system substrate-binding protein
MPTLCGLSFFHRQAYQFCRMPFATGVKGRVSNSEERRIKMNIPRKVMGCCVIALVGILLTAISSYAASDVPALRSIGDPGELNRVKKLIDGARNEKKLVWATNYITPEMSLPLFEGFKAYYGLSELTQEVTNVGSGAIVTRVEQLLQAKRTPPDIIWYGNWAWYQDLLARQHIMRYESPMYKEYTISNRIGNSMPGYWVSDSYTFHPAWNPDALAKRGIKNFNPTSYLDFADSRFNGLMSCTNFPQTQTDALIAMGWRKVVGDEWFKKIATLKPALFTRNAQGRDWLAAGEYPVMMTCSAKHALVARKTGASVKLLYPKEGIVMLPYAPIIMAATPHPNISKLFIDYVRSAAGTNALAETGVALLYGRPGVKTMPDEREYLPKSEEVAVIPMDWKSEGTTEALSKFQKWIIDIGLSY